VNGTTRGRTHLSVLGGIALVAVVLGGLVGTSAATAADSGKQRAGSAERSWKTGVGWTARPASESISRFSAMYAKPASWLASIDRLPAGLKIVITDDPDLNCGITSKPRATEVAGCYRYEYGKTLFLYWGSKATSAMKELVLLHELSHFEQQWGQYNLVVSAYDSDIPRSTLSRILETDATCRVYEEWNLTRYRALDDAISAPCGSTKWNDGWLAAKLAKNGVTVTEW
jgi:hypothetical protein